MKPKGLILIAPPGAGKGTLAKEFILSGKFYHFSSGDYFRSLFEKQNLSELEQKVLFFMKNNLYVPDNITIDLFKEYFQNSILNQISESGIKENNPFENNYYNKNVFNKYILLDGIPRTINQIKPIEEIIDVVKAIYINVGESYKEIRNNVVKKIIARSRNEADIDLKKIIFRIRQYFDEGTDKIREYYKNNGKLIEVSNKKTKSAYIMTVDRLSDYFV